MEKASRLGPGDTVAEITFEVTNRGAQTVVIDAVEPSCGCTIAEMPADPWRLAPGASGRLRLKIDLTGKTGELTKSVRIRSAAGEQTLTMKLTAPLMNAADRERNQQLAQADRQTVFRGDCARCHAAPAANTRGAELYQKACAICHDAPHRAAIVPDLGPATTRRDAAYWRGLIAEGRAQTLMPAFAQTRGGPLTEEQIASLVDFLVDNFQREPAPE